MGRKKSIIPKLKSSIKERDKEISASQAIVFSLVSSLNSDDIFKTLVNKIGDVIEVARCSIVVIQPDESKGKIIATYENPDITGLNIDLKKYPEITEVLRTKQEMIIQDTFKSPVLTEVKSSLKNVPISSIMVLPITFNDDLFGTVFLRTSRAKKGFSKTEINFCKLAAAAAAIGLKNAELYNNVKTSFFKSILSLAKALEKRDIYTHDHSENVAKIAFQIAVRLSLSQREIENVWYASLLHDIGKIGIHDAILNKGEKLLPYEKLEIQKHPQIGVDIISPIPGIEDKIPMVLHHHEAFDGSGYPSNLKGEEIPLGARIISIADAYEAMSSERPYRKPLQNSSIKKELEKCAGVQFDPYIINPFIDMLIKDEPLVSNSQQSYLYFNYI